MKIESKTSVGTHDPTATTVEQPFDLPDLTKKPVGLRVRSHVRGGALKCGGDPETM